MTMPDVTTPAAIAAARIEALEADVDRFVGQRDKALEFISVNAARIEALEAALREIADLVDSEAGEPLDDAIAVARAALDKDDGK
jgi:HAMP domain-containing protein